ncbi:LysR family transcriptional regulator [Pseudoalteromonas piratica]|uniref:LysR family transcriptional regulator n=1 Tax=Pseudoalteromonas piratica TaxID=1348114 RepID=UPI00068D729E|nr:LysR family transcriptional regulator [Pseudoalteromonas piratica]
MDIKVFKTFIAVAENKHFGKAAEQLYITQAAVSARIKQLEEYYNTPMFIRDKNNLTLTPAGSALLPFAHLVIEQIDQSKTVVGSASKQKELFNIAATPNVWDAFLSGHMSEMNARLNSVVVGTEISVREAIQRKLDDKSLSIAFLTDPIKDSDFTNTLIGHFDITLVGTEAEFRDDVSNYIFVDWGITFAKEHTSQHKVQAMHRTSTAVIAFDLMLAHSGFAYLPTHLVQGHIDEGRLYNIASSMQLTRPVYLTHKKSAPQAALIEEIITLLSVK